MSEEYGIEKLKEAALLLVKFGHKLDEALEDKKLTWLEGINIAISVAPGAFALVPDVDQIKKEFLDLSVEETEELSEFIATNLDLDNDIIELAVEKGIEVLVAINEFRLTIADAKGKDVEE